MTAFETFANDQGATLLLMAFSFGASAGLLLAVIIITCVRLLDHICISRRQSKYRHPSFVPAFQPLYGLCWHLRHSEQVWTFDRQQGAYLLHSWTNETPMLLKGRWYTDIIGSNARGQYSPPRPPYGWSNKQKAAYAAPNRATYAHRRVVGRSWGVNRG